MIVLHKHTANFTTIGNKLFDDERLKADEVGILAYLLSRPHNWEVRRPALMRRWNIGREAVRRIIRNLVRFGYCRVERKRLDNGTTYVIYEIRDQPGPELTEEEAKAALALESSAAAPDQIDGENEPDHVRVGDDPLTGYPSTVGPPPADPSLVYIEDLTNTDFNKDDSTQKSERECARVRAKHVTNLTEFKRRWPTAASDDQARTDHAWFELDAQEGENALAGIGPFVAKLKSDKRTTVPAGWKYLKEKRWTLLAKPVVAAGLTTYPPDSPEAKAIIALHEIVGRTAALRIHRRSDGSMSFLKPITPQLLALAQIPPRAEWVTLDRNQAGSWESMLKQFFDAGLVRNHLRAGDPAPWPFAPSKEGKIYTDSTGPPIADLSDQELADFK